MNGNFWKTIVLTLTIQAYHAQTECILVSPFQGDSLSTSQPFFSWIDSGGQSNADSYSYRLFIFRREEEQSSVQTLENNLYVYQSGDLKQSQWYYPEEAPTLSEGSYLWKIEKYQMNVLVDKSDVWMFVIRKRNQ